MMGPQEDYVETLVTCEGDFHDPLLYSHVLSFQNDLQHLLIQDERERLVLRKVEPWNSVRVTFNIPRDAALRLKQLAEQGNQTLRQIGVLGVQIEGDRLISLTVATSHIGPTELVVQSLTGPRVQAAITHSIQGSSSDNIAIVERGLEPGSSNKLILNENCETVSSVYCQNINGTTLASCVDQGFVAHGIKERCKSIESSFYSSAGSNSVCIPSSWLVTGHGIQLKSESMPLHDTGKATIAAQSEHHWQQHLLLSTASLPQTVLDHRTVGLPPPPPYPHCCANDTANNINSHKRASATSPLLINLLQADKLAGNFNAPAGSEAGKPKKKRRRKNRDKEVSSIAGANGGYCAQQQTGLCELSGCEPCIDLVQCRESAAAVGGASIGDLFPTFSVSQGAVTNGLPLTFEPYIRNVRPQDTRISTSYTSHVSKARSQMSSTDEILDCDSIVNPYTGIMEPRNRFSVIPSAKRRQGLLNEGSKKGIAGDDFGLVDAAIMCPLPESMQPGCACSASQHRRFHSGAYTVVKCELHDCDLPLKASKLSSSTSGHVTVESHFVNTSSATAPIPLPMLTDFRSSSPGYLSSVFTSPGSLHTLPSSNYVVPQARCSGGMLDAALSGCRQLNDGDVYKRSMVISSDCIARSVNPPCSSALPACCEMPMTYWNPTSYMQTSTLMASSLDSEGSRQHGYGNQNSLHFLSRSLSSAVRHPVAMAGITSASGFASGKPFMDGDDNSNHSSSSPPGHSEGSCFVAPLMLESHCAKVENHDSGVGSSSERSDDTTPSETGDAEFQSSVSLITDATTRDRNCCKIAASGRDGGGGEMSDSRQCDSVTVGCMQVEQCPVDMCANSGKFFAVRHLDKVMDNEQLLPMVDGKPIAWQHHVGQIEKLSKFGHRSAHFQIKAVSPNVEALQMKEKGLVISSGHGVGPGKYNTCVLPASQSCLQRAVFTDYLSAGCSSRFSLKDSVAGSAQHPDFSLVLNGVQPAQHRLPYTSTLMTSCGQTPPPPSRQAQQRTVPLTIHPFQQSFVLSSSGSTTITLPPTSLSLVADGRSPVSTLDRTSDLSTDPTRSLSCAAVHGMCHARPGATMIRTKHCFAELPTGFQCTAMGGGLSLVPVVVYTGGVPHPQGQSKAGGCDLGSELRVIANDPSSMENFATGSILDRPLPLPSSTVDQALSRFNSTHRSFPAAASVSSKQASNNGRQTSLDSVPGEVPVCATCCGDYGYSPVECSLSHNIHTVAHKAKRSAPEIVHSALCSSLPGFSLLSAPGNAFDALSPDAEQNMIACQTSLSADMAVTPMWQQSANESRSVSSRMSNAIVTTATDLLSSVDVELLEAAYLPDDAMLDADSDLSLLGEPGLLTFDGHLSSGSSSTGISIDSRALSNITSIYSKHSSPINVNMLNHLYAAGLPQPRRLTESVQRLVKPLPIHENTVVPGWACKSPPSAASRHVFSDLFSPLLRGPVCARSPAVGLSSTSASMNCDNTAWEASASVDFAVSQAAALGTYSHRASSYQVSCSLNSPGCAQPSVPSVFNEYPLSNGNQCHGSVDGCDALLLESAPAVKSTLDRPGASEFSVDLYLPVACNPSNDSLVLSHSSSSGTQVSFSHLSPSDAHVSNMQQFVATELNIVDRSSVNFPPSIATMTATSLVPVVTSQGSSSSFPSTVLCSRSQTASVQSESSSFHSVQSSPLCRHVSQTHALSLHDPPVHDRSVRGDAVSNINWQYAPTPSPVHSSATSPPSPFTSASASMLVQRSVVPENVLPLMHSEECLTDVWMPPDSNPFQQHICAVTHDISTVSEGGCQGSDSVSNSLSLYRRSPVQIDSSNRVEGLSALHSSTDDHVSYPSVLSLSSGHCVLAERTLFQQVHRTVSAVDCDFIACKSSMSESGQARPLLVSLQDQCDGGHVSTHPRSVTNQSKLSCSTLNDERFSFSTLQRGQIARAAHPPPTHLVACQQQLLTVSGAVCVRSDASTSAPTSPPPAPVLPHGGSWSSFATASSDMSSALTTTCCFLASDMHSQSDQFSSQQMESTCCGSTEGVTVGCKGDGAVAAAGSKVDAVVEPQVLIPADVPISVSNGTSRPVHRRKLVECCPLATKHAAKACSLPNAPMTNDACYCDSVVCSAHRSAIPGEGNSCKDVDGANVIVSLMGDKGGFEVERDKPTGRSHHDRNIIEATPEEVAEKMAAASTGGRRRLHYHYVPENCISQSYFDVPVVSGRTRSQGGSRNGKEVVVVTGSLSYAAIETTLVSGQQPSSSGCLADGAGSMKRPIRLARDKDCSDLVQFKQKCS